MAFIGGALAIKPVVAVVDGEIIMLGKARGSKNGSNFLIREIEKADGVDFSAEASRKLTDIQKRDDANELGLCMVKTHLSLSDDPGVKGRSQGMEAAYPRRAHLGGAARGSGFRFHHAHARNGLQSFFRRVDVDVDTRQGEGDLLSA